MKLLLIFEILGCCIENLVNLGQGGSNTAQQSCQSPSIRLLFYNRNEKILVYVFFYFALLQKKRFSIVLPQ